MAEHTRTACSKCVYSLLHCSAPWGTNTHAHCTIHVHIVPCSNWEEGVYSRVELRFEEPDKGNTLVTLTQVRARLGRREGGVWMRAAHCTDCKPGRCCLQPPTPGVHANMSASAA